MVGGRWQPGLSGLITPVQTSLANDQRLMMTMMTVMMIKTTKMTLMRIPMMTIAITIATMATQFIRIEDGHDIEKNSMFSLLYYIFGMN